MASYYYGYNDVHTDGTVFKALAAGDRVYVAKNATIGSTTNNGFSALNGDDFIVDGTIYSGTGSAIDADGTIYVTLGLSGSVSGYNGIYGVNSGYSHIANAGSIATFHDAVSLTGDSTTIVNSGSLTSSYYRDVVVSGDYARVDNSGSMTAADDSSIIIYGSSAKINNSGSISALEGYGIFISGSIIGTQIVNTGTITSLIYAVYTGQTDDLFQNSGLVVGGVFLGGGNDSYDGHAGQVIGTVFGGIGVDTLTGSDRANDVIDGGSGADIINGGAGTDTASYEDTYASVTVDLLYADRDTGDADGDTLISIENLTGGYGGDALSGDNAANVLSGLGAVDLLYGKSGDDILLGGTGTDTLYGGLGNDRLDGGADSDTASYTDSKAAVTVNLALATQDTIGAGTDTLVSIENLVGSSLADKLTGNDAINTINGYNSDDVIDGKLGSDVLIGGAGKDIFVFDTALGAGNIDTLQGFVAADDTIRLSRAIFSTFPTTGAVAAGAFYVGAAAHDGDDRIVYDTGTGALSYDFDGDGAGAAVQFATLAAHLPITAADFVIIA